jgi:hypothetical protein
MKLHAKFEIRIPAPLLVATPKNYKELIKLQHSKDGFDVDILLLPETTARSRVCRQDGMEIHEILKIMLTVSRNEKEPPPASDRDARSSFFQSIYEDYINIAEETVNRVLTFFRYRLGNPLIRTISFYDDNNLCNPKWFNEAGNQLSPDFGVSTASCMPARYYDCEFDIRSYEHQRYRHELECELMSVDKPELYEEILSDARDAIVQENYRRAILEMAIACEIYVKQIFFRTTELSSSVFDYLESKRKIEVSTIDLINGVSREAFGESFKDNYSEDYRNIDHLFRARNKIAHLGEAFYKDDSGKKLYVYDDSLMQWWKSIKQVVDWLRTKTHT